MAQGGEGPDVVGKEGRERAALRERVCCGTGGERVEWVSRVGKGESGAAHARFEEVAAAFSSVHRRPEAPGGDAQRLGGRLADGPVRGPHGPSQPEACSAQPLGKRAGERRGLRRGAAGDRGRLWLACLAQDRVEVLWGECARPAELEQRRHGADEGGLGREKVSVEKLDELQGEARCAAGGLEAGEAEGGEDLGEGDGARELGRLRVVEQHGEGGGDDDVGGARDGAGRGHEDGHACQGPRSLRSGLADGVLRVAAALEDGRHGLFGGRNSR